MKQALTAAIISIQLVVLWQRGPVYGAEDAFSSFMAEPFKYASAWTPYFEANTGRYDSTIRYFSRGKDYWLALESQRALIGIMPPKGGSNAVPVVMEMDFVGSSPRPDMVGEKPQPRKIRYFVGEGRSDAYEVTAFSSIRYRSVFPGIDLYFMCTRSTLEYYFVLSSLADLTDVVIEFKGVERLALSEEGNLIIRTAAGTLIRPAPRFFQETAGGTRVEVQGSYVLLSGNRVGFDAPQPTELASLIVDPVLIYFDPPSNWTGGYPQPVSMDELLP